MTGVVFGRLTGVPPTNHANKKWADTMVLHFGTETLPNSEQKIYQLKQTALTLIQETTSVVSKQLLKEEAEEVEANKGGDGGKRRPCGYVIKRGDIAWNCRTCQTDPTCVICDNCFHNSNQ